LQSVPRARVLTIEQIAETLASLPVTNGRHSETR
jgi:hypothetical protein